MTVRMTQRGDSNSTYAGPQHMALSDWRRWISGLYAQIRTMGVGPEAWNLWHSTRSTLFRTHPMSPLPEDKRAEFDRIALFSYDPALNFEVSTEPLTGPERKVNVGGDGILQMRPIARTNGLLEPIGAELTIFWIGGYGGGLFLPFTDQSSGTQTYGGGRYLLDAIKGADLGQTNDGRLILDFNFAYNPSCSMNPDYICPLAPTENQLPCFVPGGEMAPN